jgi:hypothetical protein
MDRLLTHATVGFADQVIRMARVTSATRAWSMARRREHAERADLKVRERGSGAANAASDCDDVAHCGGEGGIRTRDGLPRTAFPVRRHSPLGDLSPGADACPKRSDRELAERAGFEPAVLSHTAFRERHLKPLGHLSAGEDSKARW